jgi:hypothetical protein
MPGVGRGAFFHWSSPERKQVISYSITCLASKKGLC